MDTLLNTRDKGTVKTVGFWRRADFEKVEDGEIGRQGDGHGFLGYTITGAYYALLLHRLSEEIKKKRPHLKKAHLRSFDGQNYGIKIRIITPYSPDLIPSDFFLFPNMKKWFGGQRFTSNEILPKSYLLDGLKKLEKRLEKCIELKGDYDEKKNLHKIIYFSIFF